MPEHAGHAGPGVEWRRLGRYLWAGTTEHGPIGTVEHGRRFRAIDPDGAVLGRCRSLDEAEALLVHIAEVRVASPQMA